MFAIRVTKLPQRLRRWRGAAISLALIGSAAALAASAASGSATKSKNLLVLTSAVAGTITPTNGSTTQTPTADVYDTLLWFPYKDSSTGLRSYNFKQYVGELATSYTHVKNVYTFSLRKGVKSCAGNTFTSADVVYSVARAKAAPDPGNSTAAASNYNTAGLFDSSVLSKTATDAQKQLNGEVKAVGPYKVQFTAANDNNLLPAILTQFPSAIFDSKTAQAHASSSDPWSTQWLASNAAGFGPYCLASWSSSDQSFTLTPNKHYFYTPGFDQIVVKGVPSSADRLAALLSGQADIVDGLAPDEYAKVASTKGFTKLQDFGSTLNLGLVLNYAIAPWSSGPLIHQAVAAAIDYKSIINNAEGGAGKLDQGPIPPVIPDAFSYPGVFKYNPARASQLLSQAGFPNGNGLPSAGLQLYYPAEQAATMQPVAVEIQSDLAKIGMNIQLNPIPTTTFNTRQFGTKDMSMSLQTGGVGLYNAYIYLKTWYVSTSKGGLIGVGNYSNGDVDSNYLNGVTSSDPKTKRADAKAAEDILARTLPVIPISGLPLNAAIRTGLKGIVIAGPGLMYLGHVTSS